jgi:uncharacterized protein YqeY
MSDMKQTLQSDLTESIRSRDEVRSATLRMALAAITNEEVSGKTARVLTDDEVIMVLGREAKKRRESVEAYTSAGRQELADREEAELAVLAKYLPEALSDAELSALIAQALDEIKAQGAEGMKAMGAVMKVLQPQIQGRADGAAVAAAVKAALGA